MHDPCSLFAPDVISPHHRCQILVTKHFILFSLSTDTHYQQDACPKMGQKSKHVSKFQRRKKQPTKALLWQICPKLNLAKGKTCKKMLIFDHQCVSFERRVIIIAIGVLVKQHNMPETSLTKESAGNAPCVPTTSWEKLDKSMEMSLNKIK
jgi:hypothetical protein